MSVTSINTSNGSGITATPSTGDVILNSLSAGLNGIVISGGTGKQALISASDVDFNSMSLDSASGKTVKLIADSTLANNDVYTLPPALPSATGQVLSCDTTGTMSWATNALGAVVNNPMTSNLNGGGYDITNVNELTLSGASGSLPILKLEQTTNNKYTNISCSNAQTTPAITLALPGTIGSIGDFLTVQDITGSVCQTAWVVNPFLQNPLNEDLNAGGYNITNIGTINANNVLVNPVTTPGGQLILNNTNTTPNNTTLTVTNDQSADITYVFPPVLPTQNGQILSSTTSGTMSWVTGGVLGGSFLNLAGTVSTQNNGYYGIVPITTNFPIGTYLFNTNWKFNDTADTTALTTVGTGIAYSNDVLSAEYRSTTFFNSNTAINTIVSNLIITTTATTTDLYLIANTNNASVSLGSLNFTANVYYQKIA